jgi:hypothetical protein
MIFCTPNPGGNGANQRGIRPGFNLQTEISKSYARFMSNSANCRMGLASLQEENCFNVLLLLNVFQPTVRSNLGAAGHDRDWLQSGRGVSARQCVTDISFDGYGPFIGRAARTRIPAIASGDVANSRNNNWGTRNNNRGRTTGTRTI